MKRFMMIVTLALIAVIAAACGGGDDDGGDAGDPAEAGRQFINAAFTMDVEAARNLTCEARRGEVTEVSDEQRAATEAMNLDLSGLEFTVSDQTDDSATVTVSGVIKAEAEGQEVEMPVEQMLGSETSVPVIKEDGKWVVCPAGDGS